MEIRNIINVIKTVFFHHSQNNITLGIPRTMAIITNGPFVSQPRHFQIELSLPTHNRRLVQFWKFYVRETVIALREALRGIGTCDFQCLLMDNNHALIDPSFLMMRNNSLYDIDLNDQISNLIEAIENTETAFAGGIQGLLGQIQQGFLGDGSTFTDWSHSGNTFILNTPNFDIRNCNLVYKMYFSINENIDLNVALNTFFRSMGQYSTRLHDYITNRADSIDIELDNPDIVQNVNDLIENQFDDDDDEQIDNDDDDEEIISDVEPDPQQIDSEIDEPLVIPMTNRLARLRRDPRTLISHLNRSGPYNLRSVRRINPKVYTFQKHNRIHTGRGLKRPSWMDNVWNESSSMTLGKELLRNLKARQLEISQRRKKRR